MKKIIENKLISSPAKGGKYLLTAFTLLCTFSLFAGNRMPEYDSLSVFSNPLFFALLVIVILLLIVIAVLGGVLVNVAKATRSKWDKGKMMGVLLLGFLFAGNSSFAAEAAGLSPVPFPPDNMLYIMLTLIGFEVLVIIVLLNAIQLFIKKERASAPVAVKEKPSLFEKLNASVAIEKEEEILFDHVYDGIRELDNDLPPWWKYGFYATIVFACAYMINYHVISSGDLQIEEYNKSLATAQLAKEEYEKRNASNVNENTAQMISDPAELATGQKLFIESCAVCHGKLGEGGVGPNLTDAYWLHGGSMKDIFSSVKFGWPDKGMKSWQADLSPVQIHQISSFIITLNGTNPPNQKEKQGELYQDAPKVAGDKLATDSLASKSL